MYLVDWLSSDSVVSSVVSSSSAENIQSTIWYNSFLFVLTISNGILIVIYVQSIPNAYHPHFSPETPSL